MNYIKIFVPKNNNLRHASDSFAEALKPNDDSANHKLEKLDRVNWRVIINLIKEISWCYSCIQKYSRQWRCEISRSSV